MEIYRGAKDRDAFRAWVRDHPNGYILHEVNATQFNLHLASCETVTYPTTEHPTRHAKLCSDKLHELRRHSLEHGGHPPLANCRDCGS